MVSRYFKGRTGPVFLCLLCISLLLPLFSAWRGQQKPPNGMKSENLLDEYVENVVDFRLFVPDGWTVRMASGIVTATAEAPAGAAVSMTAFSLSGTPTLEEEWNTIKTELKKTYSGFAVESEPDFKNISNDPCVKKIAGYDAIACTYTAAIGGNPCKYRQFLLIAGGYLYVLTYSCPQERFDEGLADLDKILSAVTFDRNAPAPDGMKAATGSEARFAVSKDYSFFVEEEWTTETSTGVYTARFGGDLPTAFTVMTDSLEDPSVTPQAYFESYTEEFQSSFSDFSIQSGPTESTIKGSGGTLFPAVEYEYTVPVGEEGDQVAAYRFCQVLCKYGDKMLILTFSTTENYYDDHIEYFMDILDNFLINE